MLLGETLWRVLVIFFFSLHYYYYGFIENLAKISDNPFLITCDLEDTYFAKTFVMVASEILTYSEIYNPLMRMRIESEV